MSFQTTKANSSLTEGVTVVAPSFTTLKLNENMNKNKAINKNSLVVEGIDTRDHPDYVDAYIAYGEYMDGTPIDEDDLLDMGDLAQEMAFDSLL